MAETPNLIFSAAAVEKLREVIDTEGEGEDLRLRVSVIEDEEDQRFGFSLVQAASDDDTVIDFGLIEVVVDSPSASALDGSEVDFLVDDEGERFIVRAQQAGW